jgi:hypothetical protein
MLCVQKMSDSSSVELSVSLGDSFSRGQQKAHMAVPAGGGDDNAHLLVPSGTSGDVHVALRLKWAGDPAAESSARVLSTTRLPQGSGTLATFKLGDDRSLEVNVNVIRLQRQQAGMMSHLPLHPAWTTTMRGVC